MTATPRPSTPRLSTLADLETHVAHRVAMFKDMEMGSEEGLKRMAESFRTQLRNWLVTGQCRGLVMEESGKAVASSRTAAAYCWISHWAWASARRRMKWATAWRLTVQ